MGGGGGAGSRRGSGEEGALGGEADAAGEAVGTGRNLVEDLDGGLAHGEPRRRDEPQLAQGLGRPAVRGRGGLADDEAAADLEQGSAALGGGGRGTEAAGEDRG